MDLKYSLLFLILGWLLGLLAPAIQDRIRCRHLHKRILSGIISELSDLREKCASVTIVIETKSGRLTKDLLTWGRSVRGERPLPPPLDQLTEVTQKLERSDDVEFHELARRLKSPPGTLKELDLPYTKLKLSELELFSEPGRRRILDILFRIRIFNQQIDESRFFFKLTWDSGISKANHATAQVQEQASYDAASQQSRLIVDLVTLALKELRE